MTSHNSVPSHSNFFETLKLLLILIPILSSYMNPAQAQPILPVEQIYQNDYLGKLDNSSHTIAESGCTLTAWTMVINYALEQEGLHKKNENGTQGDTMKYTPEDINKLLDDYRYEQKTYKKDKNGNYVKEDGKYVVEKVETKNGWGNTIDKNGQPTGSSTSINMGALSKAIENDTGKNSFEGKDLKSTRTYAPGYKDSPDIGPGGEELDKDFTFVLDQLEAGRPVVVRVADNTHSVVVASYHAKEGQPRGSGRYDIKDPWRNGDGTSIEWLDDKAYKNLIYDYGARVYKAGGVREDYLEPCEYYIDPDYLFDWEMNPGKYGPQWFQENKPVPEPATMLLFGTGLSVSMYSRYRKSRSWI